MMHTQERAKLKLHEQSSLKVHYFRSPDFSRPNIPMIFSVCEKMEIRHTISKQNILSLS